MPQLIEVPGMGVVEFPDGMTDDQIAAAIQQNMAGGNPAADARARLSQAASGPTEAISSAAQGFNIGLADVLGAPVDLINNAPRALNLLPGVSGVGRITGEKDPFLGADSIKGMMKSGRMLNVDSVDQLPEDYRVFGRMGEAVGGAAPFIAAPYLGAARMGAAAMQPITAADGLATQVVKGAAQNPAATFAKELGTTAGAAQGAGIAQLAAPDDPTANMIGQVVGSFASPTSLIARSSGLAKGGAERLIQSMTPAGREAAAAQQLQKLLLEGGEDAQTILRNIDSADPFGFNVAERSQSPTLLGIQQLAMRENPDLARRIGAGDAAAVEELTARLKGQLNLGDPNALTRTAQQEAERVQTGIGAARTEAQQGATDQIALATKAAEQAVADATDAARQALAPFDLADAASRQAASTTAKDLLERAFDNARQAERALWAQIPGDTPISPRGLLTAARDLSAERRLAMQGIAPEVSAELNLYRSMARSGRLPTANDMLKLRSELLDYARDARAGASPNSKVADIYSKLADGILNDLGALPGSEAARTFSRELHDRFSRTFAGDVLRLRSTGAEAIPGAQTLERATAGNPAAVQQRLGEMNWATSPIEFTYPVKPAGNLGPSLPGSGERPGAAVTGDLNAPPPPVSTARGRTPDLSAEMNAAQEQFIRSNIAQMIDPATGAFNTTKAATFLRDNAPLLERFPQLRQQVQDAVAAQRGAVEAGASAKASVADATASANTTLKAQEGVIGGAEKRIQQQAAFSRVLVAGEQPERAVAKALAGPNPAADIDALGKLAAKGGDDAVAGLRASTFDHLMNSATLGDGSLSFKALAEQLFKPMSSNGTPLVRQLRQSGVITATQEAQLRQMVTRGLRYEGSASVARSPKELVDGVSDMYDFLLRIAGANYGSGISVIGSNSGAPLVAAQAGSKLARKLGAKLPQERVKTILFRALEDPELMKTLLMKIKDERTAIQVERRINAALLSAGVRDAQNSGE